jgi:hypothetical protein
MIYGGTHLEEIYMRKTPRLWFAWRPVRLEDGRRAWLEDVLRHQTYDYLFEEWVTVYRSVPAAPAPEVK